VSVVVVVLTATVVDGQVVVIAGSPGDQWPGLADEVSRMIASMTLAPTA
jgi:hypothetical protein